MNRVLLYGKADKLTPWYDGFQVSPDGSFNFRLSGVEVFELKEKDHSITWFGLFRSKLDELVTSQEQSETLFRSGGCSLAIYERYVPRLWNKLEQYCNSKSQAEKDFFNLYCHLCSREVDAGASMPALIPHVYVNWYSSKEDRTKNKNPYVVDFVFKHSTFGVDDIIVIEIDGLSHYAEYISSEKLHIASEDIYSEHLRKDRWLRKQGFNVFRIGNNEVTHIASLPEEDKLEKFYDFFSEVFGEVLNVETFLEPDFDGSYFF